MSENAYQQVVSDTEAARREITPEIANHPQPAQSFSVGTHDGKSAAISREVVNSNSPRRE